LKISVHEENRRTFRVVQLVTKDGVKW